MASGIDTPPNDGEHSKELFDALSSALRDARDPDADARESLREADKAFDALHAWISRGKALPGPWRRKTRRG